MGMGSSLGVGEQQQHNKMNTKTTKSTYICSGLRPVKAESNREAASIFANREARNRFGRNWYARTVNASSWSQDGSCVEYEAFIGYTPRGERNTTVGTSYRFTVHRI